MTRQEVRALKPTEIVMALSQLTGWSLSGDGEGIAIEKAFGFATHAQAMWFVNSMGWLSERLNHHPELLVNYAHCVVRWRTHDVKGLSSLDFEAAKETDGLMPA
jgi:4a-hydroxytetrahydrobiopterin dehydratase